MSTRGIYRYNMDCGRMGDVEALFASTDEEVAAIIGKRAYFGEILGKHSEISGTVKASELRLVSDAPADVAVFDRLDLASGYNPISAVEAADEMANG